MTFAPLYQAASSHRERRPRRRRLQLLGGATGAAAFIVFGTILGRGFHSGGDADRTNSAIDSGSTTEMALSSDYGPGAAISAFTRRAQSIIAPNLPPAQSAAVSAPRWQATLTGSNGQVIQFPSGMQSNDAR